MTSSLAATRLLFRQSLSGASALPHERRGHVAPRRTRMLFGDVRGQTVGRDLLAAEPAEGLPGRDVHALHSAPACVGLWPYVKRERDMVGGTPWWRLPLALLASHPLTLPRPSFSPACSWRLSASRSIQSARPPAC